MAKTSCYVNEQDFMFTKCHKVTQSPFTACDKDSSGIFRIVHEVLVTCSVRGLLLWS